MRGGRGGGLVRTDRDGDTVADVERCSADLAGLA
jgi:hypothetical protein